MLALTYGKKLSWANPWYPLGQRGHRQSLKLGRPVAFTQLAMRPWGPGPRSRPGRPIPIPTVLVCYRLHLRHIPVRRVVAREPGKRARLWRLTNLGVKGARGDGRQGDASSSSSVGWPTRRSSGEMPHCSSSSSNVRVRRRGDDG
jgi:hypothetical protein